MPSLSRKGPAISRKGHNSPEEAKPSDPIDHSKSTLLGANKRMRKALMRPWCDVQFLRHLDKLLEIDAAITVRVE